MASLLSCTAERERELTAKDGHVGVETVESRIALEKVMESSVRSNIPQGSNSEDKNFATHVRREPRRKRLPGARNSSPDGHWKRSPKVDGNRGKQIGWGTQRVGASTYAVIMEVNVTVEQR